MHPGVVQIGSADRGEGAGAAGGRGGCRGSHTGARAERRGAPVDAMAGGGGRKPCSCVRVSAKRYKQWAAAAAAPHKTPDHATLRAMCVSGVLVPDGRSDTPVKRP